MVHCRSAHLENLFEYSLAELQKTSDKFNAVGEGVMLRNYIAALSEAVKDVPRILILLTTKNLFARYS